MKKSNGINSKPVPGKKRGMWHVREYFSALSAGGNPGVCT